MGSASRLGRTSQSRPAHDCATPSDTRRATARAALRRTWSSATGRSTIWKDGSRRRFPASTKSPPRWLKTTVTVGGLAMQRLGGQTISTVLIGQNLIFDAPGDDTVGGFYTGWAFDYVTGNGFGVFLAAEDPSCRTRACSERFGEDLRRTSYSASDRCAFVLSGHDAVGQVLAHVAKRTSQAPRTAFQRRCGIGIVGNHPKLIDARPGGHHAGRQIARHPFAAAASAVPRNGRRGSISPPPTGWPRITAGRT